MKFQLGQKVRWDDPDEGTSSGEYKVTGLPDFDPGEWDEGEFTEWDLDQLVYLIANSEGSEAEVCQFELTAIQG